MVDVRPSSYVEDGLFDSDVESVTSLYDIPGYVHGTTKRHSLSRKGSLAHNDDMRSQGKDYDVTVENSNGAIRSLDELSLEVEDEEDNAAKSSDLPAAPDGGYGWVICCGVFMNHMIFGGLGRCEGLFFLQFQSQFGSSAQLTAWPGSLMSTLNLFMGPVCGAVVSRYSVRAAFMIGTCFCFTGMLLNAFAPNIYFLFLSHTLLGGIGRGLMSGILLLNLYFDKHRSLATGLGVSGVGIGSLWIVPITQFLFDQYDFKGAFLIISGLTLHGYVMAMLFRPLSMHYRFTKSKLTKTDSELGNTAEGAPLTADKNGNIENYPLQKIAEETDSDADNHSRDLNTLLLDSNGDHLSGKIISDEGQMMEDTKNITENDSKLQSVPVTTQPSKETVVSLQDGGEPLLVNSNIMKRVQAKHSEDNCLKSSLKICFPVEFKKKGAAKRKKSFHWSLLKHVPFMVFCISNFLFILAFKTAFTFLPAIAMSKGLSKQEAALILTVSGALDTFGRMAFGFIMDLKPMRRFRPYVFNLLLFIIAGASLLIPSLTTFASFSIVCSVYGFMTGAFIAQKMVVLVDILGREMMPSSLGIQKVFQGFGTLIGPPFAGALRDALGSYDSSFYLGGASMIGSGLFLLMSTLLLNIRNRKLKS